MKRAKGQMDKSRNDLHFKRLFYYLYAKKACSCGTGVLTKVKVSVVVVVFWIVMPYSLVYAFRRFEGTYCPLFQDWSFSPLDGGSMLLRNICSHGVTTQATSNA
jgi:hypothetical protein